MRSLLLFLLVVSLFYSCSGTAQFVLLALFDDSSSTSLSVTAKAMQGDGEIYLSIEPKSGASTQESIKYAVNYASLASNTTCDISISIDNSLTTNVDGPSGGVPFAIVSYSAITGLKIKEKAVATGAVDENGNVLPVGGLYEKINSALYEHFEYVVVPPLSFHDRVVLAPMFDKIEIFEAQNLDQVFGFFFYNQSLTRSNFTFDLRPLPNITLYGSIIPGFSEVTDEIILLEKDLLPLLIGNDNFDQLYSYLSHEIEIQNYLKEKGYLFTAANEAFLNYIDISSLLNYDTFTLEEKKSQIESCLSSLPNVDKNMGNFEYVTGSDLRKHWAFRQILFTNISNISIKEEKFFAFNKLMYADAWCKVSKSLSNQAKSNGALFDESLLKDLAADKLSTAKALDIGSDRDLAEHIYSSESLFNSSLYSASIYDSTYVITMYQTRNTNSSDFSEEISKFRQKDSFSLWGKIYRSQAEFYTHTDNKTAYSLFVYSNNLDNATNQIIGLVSKNDNLVDTSKPVDITCLPAFMLVIFGGFIYARLS